MSASRKRKIRIGVLVYHGCSAWIVTGILEAFQLANVLASAQQKPQEVIFEFNTVTPRGQKVTANGGIKLTSVRPSGFLDALVVPPIWHRSRADLSVALTHLRRLLQQLPSLARRSRVIASVCSGAVLLAEAGLLDGKIVTTCWWLAEWFRRKYPKVRVESDRFLSIDGRIWTSAAGSAYVHMCLKIISTMAGKDLAASTARFLLVEPNRETQAPYSSLDIANSDSATMAKLRDFVRENLSRPFSVPELASVANMSLRTLFRYFHKDAGMTPLEFVQRIRIEHAKKLLEVTREPVDSIASKCGYEDVSSFRKLFRELVRLTPKEYRARFGRY